MYVQRVIVNCEWRDEGGGYHVCTRCGIPAAKFQRFTDRFPPERNCPVRVEGDPRTLREKFREWRTAVDEWKAAGSPERSAEEQNLIADVCRGCQYYDPDPLLPIVMGGGSCKACGCGIKPERALFNALRFATYKCRIGKWNGLIAKKLISYVRAAKRKG